MTLRYANGTTIEAALLSRTDLTMRVALPGCDDVMELNQVNGVWVSDDCEPVQVCFAWENLTAATPPDEYFVCPPELAGRLLRMLFSPEEQDGEAAAMTIAPVRPAITARQLV